jgi:hypothetical protein
MTPRQLADVMSRYPNLGVLGFRHHDWREHNTTTRRERDEKFERDRQALLESESTVTLVADWLARNVEPMKTPTSRYGSYGIKHIAEKLINDPRQGHYITNGQLIAAALVAGFKVGRIEGPNCNFNMSTRSLNEQWCRAARGGSHSGPHTPDCPQRSA